jgi:hypothetical protein
MAHAERDCEDNWTEIAMKSDKHAKKLAKKAAKGECNTKQSFIDCYGLSLRGHPSISVELDKSRETARHNLNLSVCPPFRKFNWSGLTAVATSLLIYALRLSLRRFAI